MATKWAQYEMVPGQYKIGQIVGSSIPSERMIHDMRPDHVALARKGVIGFVFERQVAHALHEGGLEPLLRHPIKTSTFTARPTSLFGGIQVTQANHLDLELDSVVSFNGAPVYVECKSGGPGRSLRFDRLDECYRALQIISIHLCGTHDSNFRAGLTVVTPARTGIDLSKTLWEQRVRRHGGIICRTPDTLFELQQEILRLIQNRFPRTI